MTSPDAGERRAAARATAPATPPRLPALAASLASLALYVLTCYPSPDWLDGPELAGAALRLGVFHPPGSPLAVMLGQLAALWPFGPAAGVLVYYSAIFAALAVYQATRIIQLAWSAGGRDSDAAGGFFCATAGLTFALMPAVLSQATRLEVYSLALLLFLLALRSMLSASLATEPEHASRQAERTLVFSGMGAATHPLIALSLLAGLPAIAASRERWRLWFAPRRLAKLMLCFVLGCAPIFMIAAMVHTPADLRWGDPGTFLGFLKFISGSTFSHSFSLKPSGVAGGWLRALTALIAGLGLPLAVSSLAGGYLLLRSRARLLLALVMIAAAGMPGLALQPSVRLDNPDVMGYTLASAACVFLIASLGLVTLGRRLAAARPRAVWLLAALWPALGIGTALSCERPLDHSGCTSGRALAVEALTGLPGHALVLLADFNLVFMFDYLQSAESVRPDVDVLYLRDLENRPLRAALGRYDPALEKSLPRTASPGPRALEKLAAGRPLFIDLGPHLPANLLPALRPDGLLWRLNPDGAPAGDGLFEQAAFFSGVAPPVCRAGQIDRRSAEVASWHAYWQALAAHASGREVLAGLMLAFAACAAPADAEIARAAGALGLARHTVCSPASGALAAPPMGDSRRRPWRTACLLLGLVSWLGGALRPRRWWLAAPWPAAGMALAGLLLVLLAIV